MFNMSYTCPKCGHHGEVLANPGGDFTHWPCLNCGNKIPEPELIYTRNTDKDANRKQVI
jgi:predicted RNA-binding Zn-ribbon protein involved in translation (DUF1610 family)